MATSSRLRGNINPIFTLKLDDDATATSYADDLQKFELEPKDKDGSDLTFAEAAAGAGKDWTLKTTCLLSNDTGALYQYCWTNAGAEVEIILGPHGNAVATPAKPHYKFRATVPTPSVSNEASLGSTGASVELEWAGTSAVTQVTSA